MERPFRLIQMINPATIPTSNIKPVMIPTTVSSIEESKSPVTHKNTIYVNILFALGYWTWHSCSHQTIPFPASPLETKCATKET
jgi:hypothetical protein